MKTINGRIYFSACELHVAIDLNHGASILFYGPIVKSITKPRLEGKKVRYLLVV